MWEGLVENASNYLLSHRSMYHTGTGVAGLVPSVVIEAPFVRRIGALVLGQAGLLVVQRPANGHDEI